MIVTQTLISHLKGAPKDCNSLQLKYTSKIIGRMTIDKIVYSDGNEKDGKWLVRLACCSGYEHPQNFPLLPPEHR